MSSQIYHNFGILGHKITLLRGNGFEPKESNKYIWVGIINGKTYIVDIRWNLQKISSNLAEWKNTQ